VGFPPLVVSSSSNLLAGLLIKRVNKEVR